MGSWKAPKLKANPSPAALKAIPSRISRARVGVGVNICSYSIYSAVKYVFCGCQTQTQAVHVPNSHNHPEMWFLTPYFPRYKGERAAQGRSSKVPSRRRDPSWELSPPGRGPGAPGEKPTWVGSGRPVSLPRAAGAAAHRSHLDPQRRPLPGPEGRAAGARRPEPRPRVPAPRSPPGAGRPAAAGRDARPPPGAREAIRRRGGARDTARVEPENREAFFLGPARSGYHGVWEESPRPVCDLRGPPYR